MKQDHPTVQRLLEKFGAQHFSVEEFADMVTVTAPKSILLEIMQYLHDDPECDYAQLTDVMGIDYQGYPKPSPRFAIVYPVLSLKHNRRLFIKILLEEPDLSVPSLTGIYASAEWAEREAAEMFGFVFEGHPDPRRLLLCDLFEGEHPLRKEYPLRGKGERERFEMISREDA